MNVRVDDSQNSRPVVVVTAAGRGIGAAVATTLWGRGHRLVVSDIDEHALVEASSRWPSTEAEVAPLAVTADVTCLADAERVIQSAVDAWGRLDGLVNVVGGSRPGKTIAETTAEEWSWTMALNLGSVFAMSRAALPALRVTGGSIVNIGSGAGIRGMRNNPAYCAAKAGVIGLTRAMAIDHTPEGVRVNCVSPGPILTPLMERNRTEEEIAAMGSLSLTGRIGTPTEIAAAVSWLLGPEASYVTGQTIEVDGGPAPLI